MTDNNSSSNVAVAQKTHIALPPKYNVVLHNDNFTPMVFVVNILKSVFNMDDKSAFNVMMKIHVEGKQVVGTYIKSVAETKVLLVHELAEHEGYHLTATMEEA